MSLVDDILFNLLEKKIRRRSVNLHAILIVTGFDSVFHPYEYGRPSEVEWKRTAHWVFRDDDYSPFSLVNCCDVCDVNVFIFRAKYNGLLDIVQSLRKRHNQRAIQNLRAEFWGRGWIIQMHTTSMSQRPTANHIVFGRSLLAGKTKPKVDLGEDDFGYWSVGLKILEGGHCAAQTTFDNF